MCIKNCLYNVVHFFSRGQIFCKKFIYPFFRHIYNFFNCDQNEIIQFKNGQIKKGFYTDKINNYFEDFDCMYIFVDNKNKNKKCANKIISRTQNTFPDYEVSNIKFMLIETTIKNKVYQIFLKTDTYNYFIVDNIFDINFFKYYFNNYYNMYDNIFLENIKLKIIDNNINIIENIEITSQKYIIIKKDSYIIIK